MAKRKKADPVDKVTHEPIAADSVFAGMITDMQAKLKKRDVLVGHSEDIVVLPVPAFIIRYLLHNTGLPLSCIYQIVGPEGCYKSTMAMEWLRWHRLCGGFGQLNEAETKPTPDLRNSVLNWDPGAVHVESCGTFEEWQMKVTFANAAFQKQCLKAGGPGRTIPFCHVVDSLTGKAGAHTLKNIDEKGHASMHFATEARQMADYLRAFPQKLIDWPITFVGINHMKVHIDPQTNQVDYNIPGGWSLRFQCAAIVAMEKIGAIKEYANYKAALVQLQTIKNSYGPDKTRIQVRFRTWYNEDAPGVWRLHSRFEWWEAGIHFLAKGQGLTKAKAEALVPKMREVCDVREKSGGSLGKLFWSKRLGVSSSDAMPAHDLGLQLEMRPDVLTDLYTVLGIAQKPYFKPGLDFLTQRAGYNHFQQQSEAIDESVAKLRALHAQQRGLGLIDERPLPVGEVPMAWPVPAGDAADDEEPADG
jgi:RecA/RadA recombinase